MLTTQVFFIAVVLLICVGKACQISFFKKETNHIPDLSLVKVLTIRNDAVWPFYHTALEFSGRDFNQTYGFYSSFKGYKFFLLGWLNHQGNVLSPDLFLQGSTGGTILPGELVGEPIVFRFDEKQTQALRKRLEYFFYNPGNYSYINRYNVDNCVSWVEKILNPILVNEKLDCSLASWLPLSIPSACIKLNKMENSI